MKLLAETKHHVPVSWSLVGVQKAATSTLYRMLVTHRDVVAGPEKEMRFFIEERRDWTAPDYSDYLRPARSPRPTSAGDATPDYFYWPRALERMQRYRPDMRLMVTVRDPIERAMSQWSMQRDRDPRFPDVPDTITSFASSTLPDHIPDGMAPYEFGRRALYTRGLYGQQLQRGYELFGADAWLVLDFRDVTRQPESTLDRVTDHLGLATFRNYPKLRHSNATRSDHLGAPPRAEHVQRLVDIYADDLPTFAALSGLDLSGWPTWQVLHGELDVAEFAERIGRKLGLR